MAHLYKNEVVKLAKELKIPQKIIDQPPSACLWPGQTDEGELGFSYHEAEDYFKNKKQNKKIEQWLKKVEFKKRVPYTL